MDEYSSKSEIEKVHIDYLCRNFALETAESANLRFPDFKPDLCGVEDLAMTLFEVKTRIFPRNQIGEKRPRSSFAWWSLHTKQIECYQRAARTNNFDLFWIFLIGTTEERVSSNRELSEKLVRERDIYVVPWEAHGLVESTEVELKYLGLARLKREYKFNDYKIRKGELHLARNAEPKLAKYFL